MRKEGEGTSKTYFKWRDRIKGLECPNLTTDILVTSEGIKSQIMNT